MGDYVKNPDGLWARVKQGEEFGPTQAEALVAHPTPHNKQKCMKPTVEPREFKEGFLGSSAGLSMVDM